jgi:Fe-S-cluster containining protein
MEIKMIEELMKMFKLKEKEKYFYKYMEELGEILESSHKKGLSNCNKCGFCCYMMPCDLIKEDIFKLANYLKITKKELFNKYLIFQPYIDGYTLIPIRKSQQDIAGQIKPLERSFDIEPCIFLSVDNKCSIEVVKPKGGRHYKCWEDNEKYYLWNIKEVNKLIADLK